MNGKGPLYASAKKITYPNWNVGFIDKGNMRYPAREIWIKSGGIGGNSGSGPTGWKLKPARIRSRSLAEMAAKYRKVKK